MLEPVYESQTRLQNLLVADFGTKLHEVTDKVGELEECLYEQGTKEDRFTKLGNKVTNFQVEIREFCVDLKN